MDLELIAQVLGSATRLSTPILLACLAGLFSERAGILDIGLEGKMMIAAFAAAAGASLTGSAVLGLCAAISASLAFALLHGFASITLRGSQLISGVSINILSLGLAGLIGSALFGLGGNTPSLTNDMRFKNLKLPFHDDLGVFYRDVVSGHSFIVYLGFACALGTWWLIYKTRFGLRLRAVGEAPGAVETAGISVARIRYSAVAIAGILCGFAGAYLSISLSAGYTEAMTANRGFIALAALIFAKWRPIAALYTCLLFGLVQATGFQIQGVVEFESRWLSTLVEFIEASFPYLVTVIVLAGFVGKATPPAAGGLPYTKEH